MSIELCDSHCFVSNWHRAPRIEFFIRVSGGIGHPPRLFAELRSLRSTAATLALTERGNDSLYVRRRTDYAPVPRLARDLEVSDYEWFWMTDTGAKLGFGELSALSTR